MNITHSARLGQNIDLPTKTPPAKELIAVIALGAIALAGVYLVYRGFEKLDQMWNKEGKEPKDNKASTTSAPVTKVAMQKLPVKQSKEKLMRKSIYGDYLTFLSEEEERTVRKALRTSYQSSTNPVSSTTNGNRKKSTQTTQVGETAGRANTNTANKETTELPKQLSNETGQKYGNKPIGISTNTDTANKKIAVLPKRLSNETDEQYGNRLGKILVPWYETNMPIDTLAKFFKKGSEIRNCLEDTRYETRLGRAYKYRSVLCLWNLEKRSIDELNEQMTQVLNGTYVPKGERDVTAYL